MNKINELQPHHLNCNQFSVYDYEAMSMQELLSTFYSKIQECVKQSNEVIDLADWLVNEGLTKEVADNLVKWLNDGTLETIINKNIFEELHKSISYFDLEQNPILYTGVRGKETSVMQDIHILKNNNILISQVSPSSTDETESFTVTQCTVRGDIINYMTVKNGGHGNFTAYESACGNIYIIFCDNNNNLRKLPYIAGTYEVDDAETMFKATTERAYAKINVDDNLLSLTMKNNLGEWYCTDIFDLEKYLSGESYKVLRHFNHPPIGTMQGTAVDKDKFYLYYGGVNELIKIVEIDMKTCERKEYEYPRIVNATNSENTTTEAEGMCIANNQLFIGIALGEPTVLRENCIYTFLPVNKIMDKLNTILNNVQMYKMTEASGTAKSFKHNNVLSNIKSPGEYYFTGTQFAEITDVPNYCIETGSGFFLTVSAKAKDGSIIQTLKRNTSGKNRFVLERSIIVDGTVSDWMQLAPERNTLHVGDTRTHSTITLEDSILNYDFIIVTVWSPTGKATTQVLYTNAAPVTDRKMVFAGINLPDSGTSTNFFAWELHAEISEDGMTISQTKKNQMTIANGGVNTPTTTCDVGIYSIVGIRGFRNI